MFIDGDSRGVLDDEPIPIVSALEVAQTIKAELQLSAVDIVELNNGALELTGYVPTLQDKSDLQLALQMKGIPFNVQVTALQEMRDNAQMVLQSEGYDTLTLALSDIPGVLTLSGYVATGDVLAEIATLLESQIYGLKSVDENVETERSRAEIFSDLYERMDLHQELM